MNLRFIEARGVRKSLRHVIVVFMPDVKIKDGGSEFPASFRWSSGIFAVSHVAAPGSNTARASYL